MRKLLCLAIFSIAIMANAAVKNEIVTNNSKEVYVEMSDLKMENFEEDMRMGCGSQGNQHYKIKRSEGASHREARKSRRAYVRECRGYFWQFEG